MAKSVSRDVTAAIQTADWIDTEIHSSVCEACGDVCYSVRITAFIGLGEQHARSVVFAKQHGRLAETLSEAGMMLASFGSKVRKREQAVWLMEHSPRLF